MKFTIFREEASNRNLERLVLQELGVFVLKRPTWCENLEGAIYRSSESPAMSSLRRNIQEQGVFRTKKPYLVRKP